MFMNMRENVTTTRPGPRSAGVHQVEHERRLYRDVGAIHARPAGTADVGGVGGGVFRSRASWPGWSPHASRSPPLDCWNDAGPRLRLGGGRRSLVRRCSTTGLAGWSRSSGLLLVVVDHGRESPLDDGSAAVDHGSAAGEGAPCGAGRHQHRPGLLVVTGRFPTITAQQPTTGEARGSPAGPGRDQVGEGGRSGHVEVVGVGAGSRRRPSSQGHDTISRSWLRQAPMSMPGESVVGSSSGR